MSIKAGKKKKWGNQIISKKWGGNRRKCNTRIYNEGAIDHAAII